MSRERCRANLKGRGGGRCKHEARIGDLCLPHFIVEYRGGKVERIEEDKDGEKSSA